MSPKRSRVRAILTALELVPKPPDSDTPEGRPVDQVIKKRASVAAKGGAWATLLVVVQLLVGESGKWREEFKAQAEAAKVRDAAAAEVMKGVRASIETLIAESRDTRSEAKAQREFWNAALAARYNAPQPAPAPPAKVAEFRGKK